MSRAGQIPVGISGSTIIQNTGVEFPSLPWYECKTFGAKYGETECDRETIYD
jgi:hypothetical protein